MWAVLCIAIALPSCTACANGAAAASHGRGRLALVASFYPLQWMAQRIAGDRATVTSLTKPGAEPHDLELTPRDVARLGDADLVVYLSGFQPAVDQAVDQEARSHSYDASADAQLDLTYSPIEAGRRTSGKAGATDPHFWLDPIRLGAVADAFARRLGQIDRGSASQYQMRADALKSELAGLDRQFETGLANCANRDLVTSHNAFGYLARRYHMKQVGITGLTPEQEPSAGDLATVADFVKKNHVRTIYYETLVSPTIARTVASETRARAAVLDPIEGLNDDSQGADYLGIMRSNLANIRTGQPCT